MNTPAGNLALIAERTRENVAVNIRSLHANLIEGFQKFWSAPNDELAQGFTVMGKDWFDAQMVEFGTNIYLANQLAVANPSLGLSEFKADKPRSVTWSSEGVATVMDLEPETPAE